MKWSEAKKELLKDEKLRKAYNQLDPIYWLSKRLTNFLIWLKGNK